MTKCVVCGASLMECWNFRVPVGMGVSEHACPCSKCGIMHFALAGSPNYGNLLLAVDDSSVCFVFDFGTQKVSRCALPETGEEEQPE